MSIIDTPNALDAALAGCNRKGNREKALINALKRDHTQMRDQLRAGMPREFNPGGPAVGASLPELVDPIKGEEVNKADKVTVEVGTLLRYGRLSLLFVTVITVDVFTKHMLQLRQIIHCATSVLASASDSACLAAARYHYERI